MVTAQRPLLTSLDRLLSRRTLSVQRTSSACSICHTSAGGAWMCYSTTRGSPKSGNCSSSRGRVGPHAGGQSACRLFRVASRRQTHASSDADCGFRGARKVDPDRVDRRIPGWSGVHGPLRGQQSRRCQRHAYCGTGAVKPTGSLRIASALVRSTRRCGGRSTPSGAKSRDGKSVKPGSGEPLLSRSADPKPRGRGWRR